MTLMPKLCFLMSHQRPSRRSSMAAAILLAIASAMPAVSAAAAEMPKLTDVVLANPSITISLSASYLAEDLGMFEKNGLKVKVVVIPGVGATNAVISGSADFVEASSTSITRAAAHGQRLMVIAETSNRPSVEIVLRKSVAEAGNFDPRAPLDKRVALLRGHVIAVDGTGSLVDGYLLFMLKRAGIDPSGMQIPTMQPVNMLAAFQTGQIDGFAMPPPWPLVPVMQDKAVLVASGPNGDPSDLVPFANSVIATRPATCQQRRPLCVAFGRSFVEAEAYLHDHPAAALAVVRKRFPTLDDKVLTAAFNAIRAISPNPPVASPEGIANAERLNIEAGLMKPGEKLASYKGLVTDEFVK
jgi:ABC-type nitrate/sulfonate/bicarbonate transport system substrate-binding protein